MVKHLLKTEQMKTNKIRLIIECICLSIIGICNSCAPEDAVLIDRELNLANIKRVELKPSHNMLIPDGIASIDLSPLIYVEVDGKEALVPNERIADDLLEYTSSTGLKIGRSFATSDASLIGKDIDVTVSIKGTSHTSNKASFKVIAGLEDSYKKDITYPIVFHIIRMNNEEELTGLHLDKEVFTRLAEKFNLVFSGKASKYPTGVDTHIRFKPAIYAPSGQKLEEPGINRVFLDPNNFETAQVLTVIEDQNLLWDPQKYLNIWILSNSSINISSNGFTNALTKKCRPKYKMANSTNIPEGLILTDYETGSAFDMYNAGVFYPLSGIDELDRPYSFWGYYAGANELIFYLGNYFGLFENCKFRSMKPGNDYCDDTVGYFSDSQFYKKNQTVYKETPTNFFTSENIMDDPTGLHTAISKEQAIRIRWIAENSPERMAWKSSYAFTGK